MLDLWHEVKHLLEGISRGLKWAAHENRQAMERHPTERDVRYHSFPLLQATHNLMATEFVYRSHCREILERLANSADTRPGTAAEVCCMCCQISLRTPLRSEAAGQYLRLRMWTAAFPEQPMFVEPSEHHLGGSTIDELEATVRRKLTVKDRALTDVTCTGEHDGEIVQCKYAGA
ncbi:hypothetical protein LWC34_47905 [Kibdelosporangium philippinense]|uniref:Uncharacterized protein n=1 Tax=Kibdelosporangium philippinense TaxID=211113 RepID=A0ABS8ZRV4_9PSEU|nr:hypothetical protein [Kibdelosporangium philippinense]MCE7010478.1 hypothetical protein [Kibdelosporangium philippinense]